MFFLKEYKPKKIKKPDVYKARKKILENQNKNLNFLLEQRFGWMSKYLINKKNIIELGAGNGCIKQIIKNKNIILTDITKYSWIDKKVDMVKLNLHKKYINIDHLDIEMGICVIFIESVIIHFLKSLN